MDLSEINSPDDIKELSLKDMNVLAEQIRKYIIDVVSINGGHLASNLGIVELTLALLKVFDVPKDKVIFDVGHQSYVYKILTGRREEFKTLRKSSGISGFPKREESKYDVFNTGHSSTSISAGIGMARARDLKHEDSKIVSVIGDGAISNGMAFEALNDIGQKKTNMIVVLNDNEMSIERNVGAISEQLMKIRMSRRYLKLKSKVFNMLKSVPLFGDEIEKFFRGAKHAIKSLLLKDMVFEHFGLKYYGPINGHDIDDLISVFELVKNINSPVLVHVVTQKGRGYKQAEEKPEIYHGFTPHAKEDKTNSFTHNMGKNLIELASKNKDIVAITAAMTRGVGLCEFSKIYKERLFDVGICEEHAVTLSAGMACSGLKPFVCIYSTFLQRAYDQILHDVCLQNLPVVFMLDRAGLVGRDGETHHGIYDLSYLLSFPNIEVYAPSSVSELKYIMEYASTANNPIAIRYCNSDAIDFNVDSFKKEWRYVINYNSEKTILTCGSRMFELAVAASNKLKTLGKEVSVINCSCIKPLDEKLLKTISNHKILTLEDNVAGSGFGTSVLKFYSDLGIKCDVYCMGYDCTKVRHGSVKTLLNNAGINEENIIKFFEN